MNILSFTASFLILFSIITSYIISSHKNTNDLKKSIEGYYNSSFQTNNGYNNFMYKDLKAKKIKKEETSKKIDGSTSLATKKEKKKPKEKKDNKIYSCSKINIYPLLKDGKKNHKKSFDVTTKLFFTFFIKDKKLAINFLNTLIKTCQKNIKDEKSIILEKIVFSNQKLQNTWYQMLKGTKFYDFEKKIGTPSLLDFVAIKDDNKICIEKASIELLFCLFDEKTAKKIVAIRKDKKILKQFFEKPHIKNKLDCFDKIDLSHKNHKKSTSFLISTDKKSKISIKQELKFQ